MKYLLIFALHYLLFIPQVHAEISVILTENITCVCPGNPQQAFEVTATGTAGPFTFEWSGPEGYTSTEMMPSDIEISGTYTLMVTNAYECTFEYDIEVPACEGPTFNFQTSPPRFCDTEGMETGTINLSLDVDESLFSIEWYKDGEEIVGETEFMIEGLAAGNYHVVVIDGEGCRFTSEIVTLEATDEFEITATTIPSCPLEGTGSIDVAVTGNGAFEFEWDNGQTTEDLTDLSTGTYLLTVTDASGCQKEINVNVGEALVTIPSITPIINQPSCDGAMDGSIELVFDPVGDYDVTWEIGGNDNPLENLGAGNYSVTVNEGICEVGSVMGLTLTAPAALSASPTQVVDASCSEASDGSITIQVNGGTAPFTYSWEGNNSSTDAIITGLSEGTYNVTVTDANMCSTALPPVAVGSGEGLQLSLNATNVFCLNGPDGSIEVTVTNGSENYTYSWEMEEDPTFSESGSLINNLDIGTYCVTVEDASTGCTASICETLIGEAEWPYIKKVQMAAGGQLIYEAEWTITTNGCLVFTGGNTDNFTDAIFQAMQNGWTDLTISATANMEINELSLTFPEEQGINPLLLSSNLINWIFTLDAVDVSNIISNNSIDLLLSFKGISISGLPLYDFMGAGGTSACVFMPELELACNWSPTPVVNASGIYGLDQVHRLKRGCLTFDFELIPENGEIQLTNFSAPPVSITWENPSPGAAISTDDKIIKNLAGGHEYCVKVTDATGCTVRECIYLCKPLSSSYSTNTMEPCIYLSNPTTDGMVCVIVDNGINVQWIDGPYNENCWNGLTTGTYTAKLTEDQCGQELEVDISLNGESNPNIILTSSSPACPGISDGVLTVNGSGGRAPYIFQWENGMQASTATGLSTGQCHSVTVTDDCGQTATACFELPSYQPLSVDNIYTDGACNNSSNGSIDLIVTGGKSPITYNWRHLGGEISTITTSIPSISQIPGGDYEVTITDACGNETIINVEVVSLPPHFQITSTVTPTCEGVTEGTIDIEIDSNPYGNTFTYQWSNGVSTQDVIDLASGSYQVTVTSADGCNLVRTFYVPQISIDIIDVDITPACEFPDNGSIALTVFGHNGAPYSYNWSNGETTNPAIDLPAGNHCVTVTDNSGSCMEVECFDVGEVESPRIITQEIQLPPPVGNIDISVIEGTIPYSYSWNDGSTNQDLSLNGIIGNYSVTVTDVNGCQDMETYNIDHECDWANYPTLEVEVLVTPMSASMSNDGVLELEISGGIPFQTGSEYFIHWTKTDDPSFHVFNQKKIENLSEGEYCVTVSDGCTEASFCRLVVYCGDYDYGVEIDATDGPCLVQDIAENLLYGTIDVDIDNYYGDLEYAWSVDYNFSGIYSPSVFNANFDGNYGGGLDEYDLVTPYVGTYKLEFTDLTTCPFSIEVPLSSGITTEGVTYDYPNATCSILNRCNGVKYCCNNNVPYTVQLINIENPFTYSPCEGYISCPLDDGLSANFIEGTVSSSQAIGPVDDPDLIGYCEITVTCSFPDYENVASQDMTVYRFMPELCGIPIIDFEDLDNDGVLDNIDNCIGLYNPNQTDLNDNGIGDLCEDNFPDEDGDGVPDNIDNCLGWDNTDQFDFDQDGVGDECENCKYVQNPAQLDSDGDGMGNKCDLCPQIYADNPENDVDSDGDGSGDYCDNCPDHPNPTQEDSDFDEVGDVCDNCRDVQNLDQLNSDGDHLGDACDDCDYEGPSDCDPDNEVFKPSTGCCIPKALVGEDVETLGISPDEVTGSDMDIVKTEEGLSVVQIDEIKSNIGEDIRLMRVYPSPTTGITNFDFIISTGGIVEITLLNSFGQIAYQEEFDTVIGFNRVELDLSHLLDGMYYYTFTTEMGTIETGKIILLK